ncbi:efflux RND transporter permease subunit [Flammeovirga kamogawensis]|uniref:Efflux RND transporter permease subunit n=1 Tax=Flammeovirga kamogawensis TaxID=373891 RepID=A0ABX8H2B1_9BACT|nr:efflux RND transporter permease subunit [Flammeovirga kamogawensis]MBB6460232.1 multidrug efflux pump subunit AcrB [Flammeovirga kamogawensis]QWG10044.1 efflux RND transporter permease subunit [Flammeovirga kamogawensis]TRX65551.1 efflux RND transporter permease subunit [Flammeovirga kamogawensis]
MNLTKFTIENKPFSWFILLLIILGGVIANSKIGKLEDAPFTIKQAVVLTSYPGASAEEVEQQITDKLEEAIQSMDGLDYLDSDSRPGVSRILVVLKKTIPADDIPQMWDLLRRKVGDIQSSLPTNANPSIVNDDFADVLGLFYGIYGEGYTYRELNDYADDIKKELLKVDNVAKVSLFGKAQESIDIKLSYTAMNQLGVSLEDIMITLNQQNNLVNAGFINTNKQRIRVKVGGDFTDIKELNSFLVNTKNGNQIKLSEIATIEEGYVTPYTTKMKIQGQSAVGFAISASAGANVVEVSADIRAKLSKIKTDLPAGLHIKNIYDQGKESQDANDGFIFNLVASVVTVVVILLFFIGLKNGILVGSGLVFSILATIIVMWSFGINMERVSLAALIIAMGMLVDNSIVVIESILMKMKQGIPKRQAIMEAANASSWPLLGATIIAILTFLPIRISPDATGEYLSSLFSVLAISLSLSWVFALTQSALVCDVFLKDEPNKENTSDLYQGKFYDKFRSLLGLSIRYKYISLGIFLTIFSVSFFTAKYMSIVFMPELEKNLFKINAFTPEGTRIDYTEQAADEVYNWLKNQEEVKEVTVTIGMTPPRYFLASSSYGPQSNVMHFIIKCDDFDNVEKVFNRLEEQKRDLFPELFVRPELYSVMSPLDGKVEVRFMGNDIQVLDSLNHAAMDIMRSSPKARHVHSSWFNMSPIWNAEYSSNKVARAGVTRADIANSFKIVSDGLIVGTYRDENELMPIMLKTDEGSTADIIKVENMSVLSKSKTVPLPQLVNNLSVDYEYQLLQTYNRHRAISALCDPVQGVTTGELQKDIVDKIEAMDLPEGYTLMWDAEKKNQKEAVDAIVTFFPLAFLLIIAILIALFGNYKQPLIVMVLLPFSLIGVVFGLVGLNRAFDFMSFIGWIGLLGMVIKNVIVLLDEVNIQRAEGLSHFNAIISATVSRTRPVLMAAITTMFGMIPLIPDSVFGAMAVTIIFGLGFATFLTLLAVPVFYALFYNIKTK